MSLCYAKALRQFLSHVAIIKCGVCFRNCLSLSIRLCVFYRFTSFY